MTDELIMRHIENQDGELKIVESLLKGISKNSLIENLNAKSGKISQRTRRILKFLGMVLRAPLKTSKRIRENLPAGRHVRFICVYQRPIYFKS